jgi:two-component system response regulator AtoC
MAPDAVHEGRLLIVDDDRRMASHTAQWLCRQGYHASAAATATEALAALARETFDVCLLDAALPDFGTQAVERAVRNQATRPAIVSLAPQADCPNHSTVSDARLTWPAADHALLQAVATARQRRRLVKLPTHRVTDVPMVGEHDSIRRVLEVVERIAHTSATILITGETGTGKSRLARAIHEIGREAGGPSGRFVEVACGAVHESLLESELFGHVAGAFTGALRDREGRFLAADGGTIFLDEIATASPAMQVKLLRVLQEQAFEPVGGTETCEVQARAILATHEDLATLVAEGRFREDLFWRINVVAIEMPPLRNRGHDIVLLARHFLRDAEVLAGRRVAGFSDDACEALLAHRWPGNVRELEHAVRRAVLLGRGDRIERHDLPEAVQGAGPRHSDADADDGPSLKHSLAVPERQLILEALARHGWCRHAAARELGINRTSLYKKFKRLGIDVASLKPARSCTR